MQKNGIWEVVDIHDTVKPTGCKWVFQPREILRVILSVTRWSRLTTKGYMSKRFSVHVEEKIYVMKQASRQW